MGSELRWILAGFGFALIAGLWAWEKRRAGLPPVDPAARAAERFEPSFEGASVPLGSGAATVADDDSGSEPPMRAIVDERPIPFGDPPLVTIEDLPENTDDVVLAREPMPDPAERLASAAAAAVERRRTRPERRQPEPAPPPDTEEVPILEEVSDEPPAPEPPSRHQRIVSIRLVTPADRRIEGAVLAQAFSAEGLEFGRFAIFHRSLGGGRPLYSIASLIEPGSFEPEKMASQRFPGVSLFAVFPGPLPAPQAFDDLLAAARRLAERLNGSLQDDAGSSLTGQRVLSIREDLVHFEHLMQLTRSRPPA